MKGYIYVLFNKNGNYVGSTFDVKERIKEHKNAYTSWINGTGGKYMSSFKIIKDEFKYEVIEEVNVETKSELFQWEQYYMDKYDCINEKKAYQSEEERKEYLKQYNEEHKEEQKQWREEHKDERKEKNKQYNEEHKDEISKKKCEKIVCECGSELSKNNLSAHKKTKRHQDYLNN